MRRKLVGLLVILAIVVALVAIPAVSLAATTAEVTITATPTFLCMTIAYNDSHDSSWAVGTVAESTAWYWWDDEGGGQAEPGWALANADCAGNLTNCGSIACDIDGNITNFTGGAGWTVTTGAVGADTVQVTAYAEGVANEAAGVELESGTNHEIYDNLAASGVIGVDLSLETGTFSDGVAKSATVTFVIRAHA